MTRAVASLVLSALLAPPLVAQEPAPADPTSASEATTDGAEAEPEPTPAHLLDKVAAAERRGLELWRHDQAARYANDIVHNRAKLRLGDAVWLTVEAGDQLPTVRFIEKSRGRFASAADVVFANEGARLIQHKTGFVLPVGEQALARARSLAVRKRQRACAERVDVFPLRDVSGEIHVYSIAVSERPGTVVLLGHDLARVSEDGKRLVEWRALSKGCLLGEPRADDQLNMVTTFDEAPSESLTFTSLFSRIPHLFVVSVVTGNWHVSGGKISYYGAFEK